MLSITMIIVIWILAPFVELGIIVWLLIERDKNKRSLQERNMGQKLASSNLTGKKHVSGYGSWPVENTNTRAEGSEAAEPTPVSVSVPASASESASKNVNTTIKNVPRRNNMATAALILGIIFIVLAGVIFATTTWKVMADGYKVLLIFASSVLFFGASAAAKKWFAIRRTSHAFYLLGSIFLFLSVIAAAYFQIFGPEFILAGQNRWKVLWVGSLVLEGAFLAGIKCFHERMYTQASLWDMSISMMFMAKAFRVNWTDFISLMTLYAFGLIIVEAWAAQKNEHASFSVRTSVFRTFLSREVPVFARLHFWVFGSLTMLQGLFSIEIVYFFSVLGGTALLSVALGMRYLMKKRQKTGYSVMYALVVSEFCIYASLFLGEDVFCSEGILLILLCALALWDIWKKDGLEIPILVISAITQLYLFLEVGTEVWWFVYTLFIALYLFRYRKNESWKKQALSVSAGLFALAFWGQSFISWPDWIELECCLLPAVLLIWAMGEIWGKSQGMRMMQRIGYMFCLGILAWDACTTGLLIDALMIEVCCLTAFIWGQVKKDIWWTRFSGGLMLLIVVFMTKEFWLSISWWIYLLAAGIGLILFAAVSEKKKQ